MKVERCFPLVLLTLVLIITIKFKDVAFITCLGQKNNKFLVESCEKSKSMFDHFIHANVHDLPLYHGFWSVPTGCSRSSCSSMLCFFVPLHLFTVSQFFSLCHLLWPLSDSVYSLCTVTSKLSISVNFSCLDLRWQMILVIFIFHSCGAQRGQQEWNNENPPQVERICQKEQRLREKMRHTRADRSWKAVMLRISLGFFDCVIAAVKLLKSPGSN